jgi:HlyD family secretion protein
MRRVILPLALLLLLAGCESRNGPLVLSGNLETDDLDLVAPFTAELIDVRVDEGDSVAVGDTIAILDTIPVASAYWAALAAEGEAAARLADLQAGSDIENIRAAIAQLQIAQQNLDQAERDLKRSDSLLAAELIDPQTHEKTKLARDNAASSVEAAQQALALLKRGTRADQIDAARAALNRAAAELSAGRHEYERAFLTSDYNAVVQTVPYQIGEIIPAGRAVATLHSPDELWALVYVPEARLNEIALDDVIPFTVDAYPDQTFKATVVHIAGDAEFTPRNVQSPDERINLVFAVKLTVTPGQKGPRPGMPADFHFE